MVIVDQNDAATHDGTTWLVIDSKSRMPAIAASSTTRRFPGSGYSPPRWWAIASAGSVRVIR